MQSRDSRFSETDLFIAGTGSYHTYRIPALVTGPDGTILAFCEGRKDSTSDSGKIDLMMRRSSDGGESWTDAQLIASDGNDTCGNPAPVVDADTGTVWLLFCKNLAQGDETAICEGKAPRTVFRLWSDDNGASWQGPIEITDDVKPPGWSWYATGPCHGIQLKTGRLLIPCDHSVLKDRTRDDPEYSHVVYSDDHGQTWRVGGSAGEGLDESTVLETTDGWLYLNCRNKLRGPDGGNHRAIAWSNDAGLSFSPFVRDVNLPEPVCQASVCRLSEEQGHGRDRVIFSNPAALSGGHHGRRSLTVRLSYDECRNWPVAKLLHEGPAAYSDLCVSRSMEVCCLYERGTQTPYEKITFARFNVEWLTDGADTVE